jgi:hypothetical protein
MNDFSKYTEIYLKFMNENINLIDFQDVQVPDEDKKKVVDYLFEKKLTLWYTPEAADYIVMSDDVYDEEIYRSFSIINTFDYNVAKEDDILDALKNINK